MAGRNRSADFVPLTRVVRKRISGSPESASGRYHVIDSREWRALTGRSLLFHGKGRRSRELANSGFLAFFLPIECQNVSGRDCDIVRIGVLLRRACLMVDLQRNFRHVRPPVETNLTTNHSGPGVRPTIYA